MNLAVQRFTTARLMIHSQKQPAKTGDSGTGRKSPQFENAEKGLPKVLGFLEAE
jgi:hypothetical protein